MNCKDNWHDVPISHSYSRATHASNPVYVFYNELIEASHFTVNVCLYKDHVTTCMLCTETNHDELQENFFSQFTLFQVTAPCFFLTLASA